MSFIYQDPGNHLSHRMELAPSIRKTLLESTRAEWPKHPRYSGKADFFLGIHKDILNASRVLSDGLQELLEAPKYSVNEKRQASELSQFGCKLIRYAHHHHEMEDQYYFPEFRRLYRPMENAIALLDGDHLVLGEALDETAEMLKLLVNGSVSQDTIAKAYKASRVLDHVISRHLWDEEEIIIPIFLESA